jgi:glycine/D-amino acid oxidase-like deaminating enzyme
MLDRAIEYMPGLANFLRCAHGRVFAPQRPTSLPLIGRATGLSDDPSLWLAAGFEGLGITNAPGAARLLVDAMTDRHSAIDATPYLPARLKPQAEVAYA